MKTRNFAFEVKSLSEEGTLGVIEGYGSTFGGSPDTYGDVIDFGAYAASLGKHRRSGTKPKFLYQHDPRYPIGVWNELAEDGKGLLVKGQINLETQLGREAYSNLKMGALDGLSIGFQVIKAEPHPKQTGVRLVKEIDLWEISLVTFPANSRAYVTDVKSQEIEDAEKWARFVAWVQRSIFENEDWAPREFEDILRDAGVPKTLRAQPASLIRSAMRRGEPGHKEAATDAIDALANIKAALARLK